MGMCWGISFQVTTGVSLLPKKDPMRLIVPLFNISHSCELCDPFCKQDNFIWGVCDCVCR